MTGVSPNVSSTPSPISSSVLNGLTHSETGTENQANVPVIKVNGRFNLKGNHHSSYYYIIHSRRVVFASWEWLFRFASWPPFPLRPKERQGSSAEIPFKFQRKTRRKTLWIRVISQEYQGNLPTLPCIFTNDINVS